MTTAADALACLEAGARTVQVYTALIYEGPRVVRTIIEGLVRTLRDQAATASPPTA